MTYTHLDFGPLEPLLADGEVTEIMVNGTEGVFIIKRGQLVRTDAQFDNEAQILHLIEQIMAALNREIDARTPMVDARLPDGSRINAVLPPVAVNGPLLTLRKTWRQNLTWEQLVHFGSVSQRQVDFLRACVQARVNMVVAGGTASGKTTVINAISEFIPEDQRVVTAEARTELNLRHPHVVALETRPPDFDGKGAITMTDLIENAQLMCADRIITGEVRGGEAWEMLQVMTLGHEGSMFTIHADDVQDALERIELMSTAATSLPLHQIRAKIAQGIHLITQQVQLYDGSRKLVAITEVLGVKDNLIETRDVVVFEQTGEVEGRIQGDFRFTGYRPTFADRLGLPVDFFTAG